MEVLQQRPVGKARGIGQGVAFDHAIDEILQVVGLYILDGGIFVAGDPRLRHDGVDVHLAGCVLEVVGLVMLGQGDAQGELALRREAVVHRRELGIERGLEQRGDAATVEPGGHLLGFR